jgi:hypothetical protein
VADDRADPWPARARRDRAAMTLIVRLERDRAGAIRGVIERVRTGRKERFNGMEGLVALVARFVAQEPDATPAPPQHTHEEA